MAAFRALIRAHLEEVYGLRVSADLISRVIIYTTNAIESQNQVIRKNTKTRGSFPTDEAATKLIYLAIRKFEKTGRCVRGWVAARNQSAIPYPERFNR